MVETRCEGIKVRVMLADDQVQVRSALGLLLGQEAYLRVVAEAADGYELFQVAGTTHPDLLLLDWELPGSAPGGVVRALRTLFPRLKVIALSGKPEARRAALNAGVDAFVSKGDPPQRLLTVLRTICDTFNG
jgi:DNA-binding NarL/FixJ family response regulator